MSGASAGPGAGSARGGHLLAFVSAVVFVDTALYGVIAPLLPFYSAELALSKAEAGLLVAAFPAGVILGSFPAGWLVGRIGVRRTAILGLGVFGVSSLVFGLAEDPALLDLSRLAQGAGSAASWTAALAWLANETPAERRGERLGTAFSAAVGGALIGPALGAAARGTDPGVVFAIAASLALLLIAWTLRMPLPRDAERELGWSAAVRERALLPGTAVIMLVGLFFGAIDVLVPLRLDQLGAGGAAIAGGFALTSLLQAIAGRPLGRLSDRTGAVRPVQISLGAGAVLAALLPLPASVPILIGLLALCGPLVGSLLFVPGMKLLSDGAERAGLDQGYAFAIFNLAWAVTMAGGSAAAGAVAGATSDALAYALLAAVMGLALLATLLRTRGLREAVAAG